MTMAKKYWLIAMLCLGVLLTCGTAWAMTDPCAGCHKDMSKVLPKEHPTVAAGGVAQCLACHNKGKEGAAEQNPFSTKLHTVHLSKKIDCVACHNAESGKSFGLKGDVVDWGAVKPEDVKLMQEKMNSWASSGFTDNLHARAGVDCAGCHGKKAPVSDDTVENARCLECHGPVAKLAERSANKEFPKRNPHASHYGSDIACTTCHKGHDASVVMCADCHKLWKMEIPGAAK
ncbi:MAG: cytochrome c3 family protein [Acidobacteriota bacterium]|nr:cytochrome c3 family protein [Acidobacteriota bacterium]